MSQLPEYFEYLQENGQRSIMYPFAYDEDVKKFSIAGKQVKLVDFDPYTFDAADAGLEPEGMEVDEIADHPLLIPSTGSVMGGPRLHDWASRSPEAVSKAYIVMAKAYRSFFKHLSEISSEADAGHMGFASGNRRHGGVGLQVMGDCACMRPDPNGLWVRGQFEYGFAEYDLHNAGTQAQRASLYAGIGHLATLASREQV